jgi:diguanylate cyclase (GGDEF)-like protein/PAS domain S-box-containing protein
MSDNPSMIHALEQAIRHAEVKLDRIQYAFDNIDAGICLYGPDKRIMLCNNKFRELYREVADLLQVGTDYAEVARGYYRRGYESRVTHPNEDEYVDFVMTAFEKPPRPDYEFLMEDRWIWVSDRHIHDGSVVCLRVDITARKKIEQELLASESRMKSLLAMSSDWYWEQDERFRFKHISGGMVRSTGVDPNARYGKPRWEIPFLGISQEQMDEHRKKVEAHQPFRDFQYAYNTAEGELWWVSISGEPVFDGEGKFAGYRGIGTNITEKKRAEAQIRELAEYDFLTGLPNRMLLGNRFDYAARQAKRSNGSNDSIALLFIDLDRFKNINDSLGHAIGDKILAESASRLLRATRSTDTVARLGGDEFVVILPGVKSADDVAGIADTILHALAQHHDIGERELTVTPSIGITMWPSDGEDLSALIKHADVAMYHAKALGRNQFSFFREEMNERVTERVAIENALRRAIDRRELKLEYQPIFSLPDRTIVGAEALLRWQSEIMGQMSPTKFIAIAEDSGLIMPIGEWVIQESITQLAKWRAAGLPHFPVTINVSGVQWRTPRLLDTLQMALEKNHLTPHDIELELTETALVSDSDHTRKLLDRAGEMGYRLVIDDFGTGYSNLTYLKRFQIAKLKIDHSFVRDISIDSDDAAIVRGIIGLAKSLGIRVVAEGVEYPAQLDFLVAAGCDEAQGYLLARPLTPHQLQERF